jgi:hypothetical protein
MLNPSRNFAICSTACLEKEPKFRKDNLYYYSKFD